MTAKSTLPSWTSFWLRIARALALSAVVTLVALGIGIEGYHGFEGLPFLQSLLNASMILGGMGPVDTPVSSGGKLFASFYALFSGLVFLSVAALVLAPVMHRILHHFHQEIGSKS